MALEFKTRTQVVVEAIRELILSGQIKSGEPLRQAALAEQLNVSRIPVREALLQLEGEGLVKFEPHKGATATELSCEQMEELFDLRVLLETDLLRRSIPLLTASDFNHAQKLLDEMDVAFNSEHDFQELGSLNTAFHSLLYKAERHHAKEIVATLNKHADRYIRMHLILAGGIKKAGAEHREILALAKAGNIDAACDSLARHIAGAKNEIKAILVSQSEA